VTVLSFQNSSISLWEPKLNKLDFVPDRKGEFTFLHPNYRSFIPTTFRSIKYSLPFRVSLPHCAQIPLLSEQDLCSTCRKCKQSEPNSVQ